jgi:hypothetical protein
VNRFLIPFALSTTVLALAGCAGDEDEQPAESITATVPTNLGFGVDRVPSPIPVGDRSADRLEVRTDKPATLPSETRRLPLPSNGNGSLPSSAADDGN